MTHHVNDDVWADHSREESDGQTPLWNEDRSWLCLIKDTNLGCYCLWTFESAKGTKKGGVAGSWTLGLWLKLPALCHWAMSPTNSHPSSSPVWLARSDCADECMQLFDAYGSYLMWVITAKNCMHSCPCMIFHRIIRNLFFLSRMFGSCNSTFTHINVFIQSNCCCVGCCCCPPFTERWLLGNTQTRLPSATDEEWYSPKRPSSTVVESNSSLTTQR